jgi:peptidyl-prolyl cis-trans isomerase D
MVLQAIRDRLTGIMAIFILSLLIIPFAFVGVNSYFTSDTVNSVAIVNDQEITINEYNQAFQNYRRRMQAQLGSNFDPDLFDQQVVRRQFLDQMIDEELVSQVAVDAGLTVSDSRLAETIRNTPSFEVDGEFNADVYRQRLSAQGLTPSQFEQDMRVSMVVDQFPRALAESAITTSWETTDYLRLMGQERTFTALIVPAFPAEEETGGGTGEEPAEGAEDTTQTTEGSADESSDVAAEAPIEDEAVVAWYEEHRAEYMSEEQVVIEYLELDAAQLGGAVEPSDEVLRERFEQQQARFVTPEARLASHILIEVDSEAPQVDIETARETAADLARRARDGEDFAALATDNSQDIGSAGEGGDLGWIEPGYMVQAFENALYELTLDEPISEPIKTGFGWHVIYLREIRPSEGMTFTEARELLMEEYQADADERRFLEQADRMVDIIYEDPTTLSAAAEEVGVEVQQAGPFGRAGADNGIAANMEVVNAAFSDLVLGQGAVSDPIDLGTNHIVLIRVKEHMPEALKPLEEVREQVVESVLRDRAMQAARARADALLAELESGADIGELADDAGLELQNHEAVTRIRINIDAQLRRQVFLMDRPAEGSVVTGVAELGDGYAVVRLESVRDGEIEEGDEQRLEAFKRRIANASATAEVLGFIRMLRDQSTIEVFEDRL